MRKWRRTLAMFLAVAAASWGHAVRGEATSDELQASEAVDATADFQVEVVQRGLKNPCGLSLRSGLPGSGNQQFYFCESGAGRVVAIEPQRSRELKTIVEGFPIIQWQPPGEFAGPAFQVGPAATLFVTHATCAVGVAGGRDRLSSVRVYRLKSGGDAPLPFDGMELEVAPSPTGAAADPDGSPIFAMARNDAYFFTAGHTGGLANWILKATINTNKLVDLQPFVDVVQRTGVAAPHAALIDAKSGNGYLLVSQNGQVGASRDAVLGFYAPGSGRLAATFPTGLFDVSSVGYCATSGRLYAADVAWHDENSGGIYRIDAAIVDGQQTCQAVKIAEVVRPTSLRVLPDGSAMFVTTWGPDGSNRDGQVLKILGPL